MSETRLPAILGASDVFVMPNIEVPGDVEGFGIVAIEAAASGLPERQQAIVAPPENVVAAVAAEIGDGLDAPIGPRAADHGLAGDGSAVHGPDRDLAAGRVAPEEIIAAVEIEIADALDLPSRGGGGHEHGAAA